MKFPQVSPDTINNLLGEGTLKMKGGKEYLQVAYRVLAFRQMNPEAGIITETLRPGEDAPYYVKATIVDPHGTIMATAFKEIKFGRGKGAAAEFPLETAETGAIGRALALCGFGTLMGDLAEGDEIADSPLGADNNKPKGR